MVSIVVEKKTVSAQVVNAVRERILSGEYKAGMQLRQEHLAAELGVSCIPVREALHQLHSEGFVTLISHKGAVVSDVSLEELVDLYELRARLETWLLELAIPLMTVEVFDRARASAELFGREKEHSEYSHEMNWNFHVALYAASGRTKTIEIVAKIHQQIERYTRMMVSLKGGQVESHKQHLMLLDLCKTGDIEQAVALLNTHILAGGQFLMERLAKLRKDEIAPA